MCSDDDLRAIVHEHQVRRSPRQSASTCHRGGQRSSRASSLDTTSHSQSAAVFSTSVESLSQFPVFPATRSIEKQLALSDHTDSVVSQQSLVPGSSVEPIDANNQLRMKVFNYLHRFSYITIYNVSLPPVIGKCYAVTVRPINFLLIERLYNIMFCCY